ncbi:hypothetical protein CF328_g7942 [Tilletia controversa]|nr:hypothetical protein CF328_g7942 [Tilletia controversa]
MVSHELFNGYTSQLSVSPIPLTAFWATTQHAYEQHDPGMGQKFVARSTFVKLYFAYVALQQLDVALSGSKCGPTPSIVIADGIVLAYSAALRHADLAPPTRTGTDVNLRARPGTILSFLPNSLTRTTALAFAKSLEGDKDEQLAEIQRYSSALEASSASMPNAMRLWATRLKQLMLDLCLADTMDTDIRAALQHAIAQFAANDGVLQLCRPLCQSLLIELSTYELDSGDDRFLRVGTTLARHSPFLGNIMLLFVAPSMTTANHTLFRSIQLLMGSTADVIAYQMTVLNARPTPPASADDLSASTQYTQTGSLYGAPRCRTRPVYPFLDEGKTGKENEKRAIMESAADDVTQCRKFYDMYVRRQRTGGIMALWCTHCICVGFHGIPQAEGRNDVFSALFSHWPTPPNVVVYDYACQLGPYSLRRELDFFQNTLFVVDQMHEKGHVNCSAASRLSTYMRNDPKLQHVYSSAAECGNAGLARIKKSVSYSKQEHAVALVRVFLSVWNRSRMQS